MMRIRSRIHVRRDLVAKDNKTKLVSSAIGVETQGMRKRYGKAVSICGPAKVIYCPSKPLPCGAKAWIETFSKVIVHHE